MPQGNLFNAVKRLLARIIKPYPSRKLEAPYYEPAAQGPLHVQTGRNQSGVFPAHVEVQHFHQQPAQYSSVIQAATHQVHPPGQAQSQQESRHHHHHQTESLIPGPNACRPDSLDAYCALYEDPGPPDGYITTKNGRQIPLWWDPPRLLT